jgi:cellulose synthase/poly-beta-1,6-N-acetylglucosamine synthase-like glycosyltransferase
MVVVSSLAIAITVALIPFFGYLAAVTLAALSAPRPGRPIEGQGAGPGAPRFVVVIPAHDEEGVIAETVRSCLAIDYPPGLARVVVIADNCVDGTAEAARAAGAEVVERRTPDRRSKGHALEYLFGRFQGGELGPEPDAYALVDADTVVDPGLLRTFAGALARGCAWSQCYYTVRNPDASWRTRLMTYAFSLFNGVWPTGQGRLGLGVGLKGNGMCFDSRALRRFPWRAYGLVEDLEFSWMLKMAGERVHFLRETRVFGEMVSRGGAAAAAQRSRWEAGRRALRGRFLGPLLRSEQFGIVRKTAYAIELIFPPLVALAASLVLASAIHPAARIAPGLLPAARALAPIHAAMAASLLIYALSPLRVMGLPARHLLALAALPYYAAWKLAAVARRRPDAWVRTAREPIGPGPISASTAPELLQGDAHR